MASKWTKFKKNVKKKYNRLCFNLAKTTMKADIAIEKKVAALKKKKETANAKKSVNAPVKVKNNTVSINTTGFSKEQMNALRSVVKDIRDENASKGTSYRLIKGQVYYTIDADKAAIIEVLATGNNYDKINILLGNVYMSKDAAKAAAERRTIEVKLRRFAAEHNNVFDDGKYFYFYKNKTDRGVEYIDISEYSEPVQGAIAFSSLAIAEKALKTFGPDKINKLF